MVMFELEKVEIDTQHTSLTVTTIYYKCISLIRTMSKLWGGKKNDNPIAIKDDTALLQVNIL